MPQQEHAKYWSDPQIEGLELLLAAFVTHAFPRHTHEHQFVIGAVEEGTQLCVSGGEKRFFAAGTVVLLNPGTAHTGVAADHNGYRYRAIYPDIALMRTVHRHLGFSETDGDRDLPYFRFPYSFPDREMARQIIALQQSLELPASLLERETHLLTTLARLLQRYGERNPDNKNGSETRAVRQTRELLQNSAGKNISLETLAAAAGLSPFHLLRVFRQQVGVPPHAYQTQQRVKEAHRLLLQGTPVAQAAAAAGFVDQSHLTRHFKRLTGVAPGAFQRASGVCVGGERTHRNFVQA